MKTVMLTLEQKKALSGAWDYSTVQMFARQLRTEIGEGWKWMTPAVREALVAQRAFDIARAQHKGTVEVKDMDLLFRALQVATGVVEVEEVL
jgi:hypothetical protein